MSKRTVATVTIRLSMSGWCSYSIIAIAEYIGRVFNTFEASRFDVDIVSITMAEDN